MAAARSRGSGSIHAYNKPIVLTWRKFEQVTQAESCDLHVNHVVNYQCTQRDPVQLALCIILLFQAATHKLGQDSNHYSSHKQCRGLLYMPLPVQLALCIILLFQAATHKLGQDSNHYSSHKQCRGLLYMPLPATHSLANFDILKAWSRSTTCHGITIHSLCRAVLHNAAHVNLTTLLRYAIDSIVQHTQT